MLAFLDCRASRREQYTLAHSAAKKTSLRDATAGEAGIGSPQPAAPQALIAGGCVLGRRSLTAHRCLWSDAWGSRHRGSCDAPIDMMK